MNVLTFDLQLLAPCLFTSAGGGDPNTELSRNYVPGSAVRGALAGLYPGVKDAGDAQFRRLFLDGTVRFLNAYPLDESGQRTVPRPRSWQRKKDGADKSLVVDFALAGGEDGSAIWKPVDAPFCSASFDIGDPAGAGAFARLYEPKFTVNLHNAREDRQRPTAGDATLFQYAALAAGQRFGAAILSEDAAVLKVLHELLAERKRLRMGRSQHAEYGLVEVANVAFREAGDGWREVGPPATGEAPEGHIVVTLLSDVIVRDEYGTDAPNLDELVGIPHARAFAGLGIAGGFNRKWNLPLPQAQAILAGSVFVYPAEERARAALVRLEQSGVGERTAEGFGRIALNWQRHASLRVASSPIAAESQTGNERNAEAGGPSPVAPSGNSEDALLKQLARRILHARLDIQLIAAVDALRIERKGAQNAQLSRLRTVVQRSLAEGEMKRAEEQAKLVALAEHLAALRRAGKEQLEQARVRDARQGRQAEEERQPQPRFYEWLSGLAQRPDGVWTMLGYAEPPTVEVGATRVAPSPADAAQYSLRLIDGMIRFALKEEP